MSRLRVLLFVIIVSALVVTLSLLARGAINGATASGGVVVSGEYRLDGAHDGDLAVASSQIEFTSDSSVNGNVSLVGESVRIQGEISGDVTILAQHVALEGGRINGALHILADSVSINSDVAGQVLIDADTLAIGDSASFGVNSAVCVDTLTSVPANATPAERCPLNELTALRQQIELDTPSTLLVVILSAAGFTAAAALVVSIFPARLARVVRAMRRRPGRSAISGVGIFALAAGLTGTQIVLLGAVSPVGLIALPIYAIFVILFAALVVIGLVSLALLIGARLTGENPDNAQPPLVAAATGGLIVSLALVVIVLQPFGQAVGLILFAALAIVGCGAAFGTRLGAPVMARQ